MSLRYVIGESYPCQCYPVSFDQANVNGVGTLGGFFDLELDLETFVEIIEIGIDQATPMEEYLSTVRCANETETSITDQLFDCTRLHSILLL